MSKLPNEQAKIDQRIVDEIFAILPESWNGFTVTIESRVGLDGGGESVTMINPDVAGETVEPSEDLRAAVGAIAAWFAEVERPWQTLTYAGWIDPEGAWHMKITAPLP